MNLLANERAKLTTNLWQIALLAALATLAIFAVSNSIGFTDFDAWSYDETVVHAGLSEPATNIVLVDFDEATFARVRQYPIPRSLVAQAVERIGAAKPRVIGLDLFLSEPRNATEDQALQTSLTNAGNVILASQLASGHLPSVRPLPIFCQPEEPAGDSAFCQEGSAGALGYAFINVPADADGYIRHATLLAAGSPPAISFPVLLAQQFAGSTILPAGEKRFSFLGHRLAYSNALQKTFLIGSWSKQPATVIPAWKLLSGQVPASAFADKLVLIGQSDDSARDLHLTPLYRTGDAAGERQRLAGTQILAATIRTLLEGTAVLPAAKAVVFAWVFLICCLGGLAMMQFRLGVGVAAVALLAVLAIAVSLLLFGFARVWLPFVPALTGLALDVLLALGLQFVLEQTISREAKAQREQLMGLFASYVDPAVAKTIWERRSEVSLAGEERVATVMFTDIRSFTAMSSGKPPAEVLGWLNAYLTAMDEVIREHNGFLNKFIGDGLMVIFGLPLSESPEADAVAGVKAGLAMLRRVTQLNVENEGNAARPQLRIGIGIHTGTLMAGSIGSAARQEYSVIGATVNLASRLESLNKPMHTEFMISESTYELVRDRFTGLRSMGNAAVAGLVEPVAVFTIDEDSQGLRGA